VGSHFGQSQAGFLSQHHTRAGDFAEPVIRQAHDDALMDGGQRDDELLNLARADVQATADDDLLTSAIDREIPKVVEIAQVPCPQPTVCGERAR
jgi:hypothetical protein